MQCCLYFFSAIPKAIALRFASMRWARFGGMHFSIAFFTVSISNRLVSASILPSSTMFAAPFSPALVAMSVAGREIAVMSVLSQVSSTIELYPYNSNSVLTFIKLSVPKIFKCISWHNNFAIDLNNSCFQIYFHHFTKSIFPTSTSIPLPINFVTILFYIVETYCSKNIWIYWWILIFILDEQ